MNKRHYEHTLPNIRGSLSNTYFAWIMVFFILWLNMPGFGKAGISFLICIRLSFALIVQGLAKKYRSEARMIFSANQSEGPPCASEAKGYLYM